MLPMSEVHQSGRNVLSDGIESGALHLREEKRLAAQVESKEETETNGTKGAVKKSNQGGKRRRSGEGNRVARPRDPNLDCPAVKAYREIVHLQLNHIQRAEVADRVLCNERGLRIWEWTLHEFMLEGRNPKNIVPMLKAWELEYYG